MQKQKTMHGEYVEKLKSFSTSIGGKFNYEAKPTTSVKGMGWSRVEISIPHPTKSMYFIAFSGTNQAEVYSGFYGETKLQKSLVCSITQKDKLLSLFNSFSKDNTKSGRSSFDKKLSIQCNDKQFLYKLTNNYDVAKFLENTLVLPIRFEVISNYKGYIKKLGSKEMLISLHSNEWIVEQKKLEKMLDGFRILMDAVN